MKSLSLKIQIFLLVIVTVVTAGAGSFNSTWTFLFKDKIASLRELQTLSLITALQDLQNQSQVLRQELRTLAPEYFKNPEDVGKTFAEVKGPASFTWRKISLIKEEINSMIVSEDKAKYQVTQTLSGPILVVSELLRIGPERERFVLQGEIDAVVLKEVIEKIKFGSIRVRIYGRDNHSLGLFAALRDAADDGENFLEKINEDIKTQKIGSVDGRSITVETNGDRSYISYAQMKIIGAESNIYLAFSSKESDLIKEFRAFVSEQLYLLISILLGSLLLGLFITRLITKPVQSLVEATRELEKGDFSQRVETTSQNEIGQLARAFNSLTATLHSREVSLEAAQGHMRELSFQADSFKRLTDFSTKLSGILDPPLLQTTVLESWPSLVNMEVGGQMAFYLPNADKKNYKLAFGTKGHQAWFEEMSPSLWSKDTNFDSDQRLIKDKVVLIDLPKPLGASRFSRIPIVSDGEIYGVFVFALPAEQEEEKFEILVLEAQRILVSHFEAAHRYAKLREVSIRDGMTGLFNVRFFKECFEQEIKKHQELGSPLSFLFIDVDHFKKYNDTNGHPAGDQVLRMVAAAMRQTFDSKDIVGRYGGEEFVVLMKNTNHNRAMIEAERFRQLIFGKPFPHEEKQPLGHLSVSIGVSTLPTHGTDMKKVIKSADDALYRAKKKSRNLVVSANVLSRPEEDTGSEAA